jgi:multidrug efflux pump subunit AcrB
MDRSDIIAGFPLFVLLALAAVFAVLVLAFEIWNNPWVAVGLFFSGWLVVGTWYLHAKYNP